jgi:hypothetical protein
MWTWLRATRARKTIDQAHVHEIGNLYEIGSGVGLEVHELDETIVINRKDTVSGLFFFFA